MGPRLSALVSLSLANNGLEQLPDSLGELHTVKRLDFRRNDIQSLPDSLGKLQQLEVIDLRENPNLSAVAVERLKLRIPRTTVLVETEEVM